MSTLYVERILKELKCFPSEERGLSKEGKKTFQSWKVCSPAVEHTPGTLDALHTELPRRKDLRKRDEATTDKGDGLQEAHRPNSQSHKGRRRQNNLRRPLTYCRDYFRLESVGCRELNRTPWHMVAILLRIVFGEDIVEVRSYT